MSKKNTSQILFFILLILFYSINSFSQKNLYAGIEIGRRAIKISVLDVNNIKNTEYKILYFANEKLSLADHISANGKLTQDDINKTSTIVFDQLSKIRKDFNLLEENIFIAAAPVFASASNIDVLRNKITILTNKSFDIINIDEESKILFKGGIPQVDYSNALLLNIGAQNTKGGYLHKLAENKSEFISLKFDLGTVTLTDAVRKKVMYQNQVYDMSTFQEKSFDYKTILCKKVKEMLDENPILLKKEKIYLSGGAVWAFATLYYDQNIKDHYVSLSMEDIFNYDAILKNNFNKFNTLSKTNKEAARVLSTYDQKNLISANNILLAFVESIPNLDKKKIYFVKEGQIVWLISYIIDHTKKVIANF
ncbi:exopolyphosphatase [uncultured Flavobacterium sp.]|uniref:exopolyphosphatase n=1 Tax=uncultured Flavobacterium sp. TaxID=165435 RepID=UPI003081349C